MTVKNILWHFKTLGIYVKICFFLKTILEYIHKQQKHKVNHIYSARREKLLLMQLCNFFKLKNATY